jgi:Domain of unknown function (DUF4262)
MSLHEKFVWPKADHEADERIFHNVRQHGCHIVDIVDGTPRFAFSIGLYLNYGHPELMIFGMSGDDAQFVINHVRDHVSDGRKFVDGEICDDLFTDGDKICFWQVPHEVYPEYLGIAMWFYQKSNIVFPCLQMIWQDADHRFPWDAGCHPYVIEGQPLLKKMAS